LEVPQGDQGMRLDLFILKHIPRLTRTRVQEIIGRGVIDQNGKAGKSSRSVQVGERYVWEREVIEEIARPIDIPIVYEDDRLLVLNKPGNLVVHPTARVWRNTVTAWLNEHNNGSKIAHRLDRDTSGVLLCGKGTFSAYLKEQFRLSRVSKTYWAVVRGVPEFTEHRCDLALQLDEDSPLKVKMKVDPKGLASVTHVRVVERFEGYAWVECVPETGRQHQIRVHLWALGFPLIGDKLYGVSEEIFKEAADLGVTDKVREATGADRHLLHAVRTAIKLPDDEPMVFEAPMCADMASWLRPPYRTLP